MKTCPQCATDVQDAAQVCAHCQYVWPDSELGKRNARRRSNLITVAVLVAVFLAIASYIWYFNLRPAQEEEDRDRVRDCEIDEVVTGRDLDC